MSARVDPARRGAALPLAHTAPEAIWWSWAAAHTAALIVDLVDGRLLAGLVPAAHPAAEGVSGRAFMDSILEGKSVLIDMDGVLYTGDTPIPRAAEFIEKLRAEGHPFLFVTNNSDHSRETFVEKLRRMRIDASEDQVFSSAAATAEYLRRKVAGQGTAYVIGGRGTREAIEAVGWTVRDDVAEPYGVGLLEESAVQAVVVGEGYALTALRMEQAANLVCRGVPFLATNPDAYIPGPGGARLVGCGCLYRGIEIASGRPAKVIGKPEPEMMRLALGILETGAEGAAMVGDRLDTDIEGAQKLGMTTILVLSGAATRAEADLADPPPDLVVDSVADLL